MKFVIGYKSLSCKKRVNADQCQTTLTIRLNGHSGVYVVTSITMVPRRPCKKYKIQKHSIQKILIPRRKTNSVYVNDVFYNILKRPRANGQYSGLKTVNEVAGSNFGQQTTDVNPPRAHASSLVRGTNGISCIVLQFAI